jgi:hypothetical protein
MNPLVGARILIAALAAVPVLGAVASSGTDTTRAARDLLETLRPALRTELVQPFADEERTSWSYFPGRRPGIALKGLEPSERDAVFALLRSVLSAQGMRRTEGVIVLEGVIRRDPELYYLTVFGEPSDSKPWSLRFEGHHVSLHFSSATGRLVSSTPAFFGAEPANVASGPHAGLRVLGDQEDAALRLMESLDASQRKTALVASSAPGDILLRPSRKSVPDPEGLPASQMTDAQRKLLVDLVAIYTGNLREDQARAQTEKIEKAGVGSIRFAWAGETRRGGVFYYRVQGPTFVLEYDVTQSDADHVHSVYRDLENDFGGDSLRRHYAESPHHAGARLLAAGGR